jgi:hypothetical protein
LLPSLTPALILLPAVPAVICGQFPSVSRSPREVAPQGLNALQSAASAMNSLLHLHPALARIGCPTDPFPTRLSAPVGF